MEILIDSLRSKSEFIFLPSQFRLVASPKQVYSELGTSLLFLDFYV